MEWNTTLGRNINAFLTLYICMNAHMYTYIYMHHCMHMRVRAHARTHTHTHTHTHTQTPFTAAPPGKSGLGGICPGVNL